MKNMIRQIIFIILSFSIIFCEQTIKIVVNGIGILSIFNSKYVNYPDEILMNRTFFNESNITYIETNENYTNIILKWNDNINSFKNLFYNCTNITEVDISNFYSSKIITVEKMFYNCISLLSLNLNNFSLPNLNNTSHMFYSCSALISLDLSAFKNSQIVRMDYMFGGCSSIKSLDLSNIITLKAANISYLFNSCSSLISLDLSYMHLERKRELNINYFFNGCNNLKYIYFSNSVFLITGTTKHDIFNNIQDKLIICINKDLHTNIINVKNTFPNDIIEHYYYKDNKDNFCFVQNDKCPDDYNKKIIKEKECVQNCSSNNYYHYEFRNQCYESCPNNTLTNNFNCEIICSEEKPFEILENQTCVEKCSLDDLIQKKCILKYRLNSENFILEYIKNELLENHFNYSQLNDEPFIIKENNITFILTTTKNEITYNYIILGGCETKLKINYNLAIVEPLYILIINIYKEDTFENKTLFEVYGSINGVNLTKFDLLYCENIIKNDIIKCSNYTIESIINDACISCNNNYYPLYEDTLNDTNFTKCYHEPENYYFDITNKIYKRCYESCKFCKAYGNQERHNCLECRLNYTREIKINDTLNCFDINFFNITENKSSSFQMTDFYNLIDDNNITDINNINNKDNNIENESFIDYDINIINTSYIYIEDINKNYYNECKYNPEYKYEFRKKCYKECPENTIISEENKYLCNIKCSEDYPYEKIDNQVCIKDCNIEDMFNKNCKINYKDLNSNLTSKIFQEILNGNLDDLLSKVITAKEDDNFIIQDGNDYHLLSTIGNQLNNKNFSSLDFGECLEYIRNISGIKDDEELIIYKIEHNLEGYKIPIIEYILFSQDGKKQLNLSICDNMKIQYNIPIIINENDVDKYDPDSSFYNDECNTYSNENGVDMTLYDRKYEYNKNNMSLCEKGCEYILYNLTTKKVKCDCNIKKAINYQRNDEINPRDLFNKIEYNNKEISNIKVTRCFNASKEQIEKNSGFYLLFFILIIYIIIFIIFCIKGYNMLENKIDEEISKQFDQELNIKNNDNNKIDYKNKEKIHQKYKKKKKKKKRNMKENKLGINQQKNSNGLLIKPINDSNIQKLNNKKDKEITIENDNLEKMNNNIIPDKDNNYELNRLSYKLAIKYDKRSCCEYYMSLLKYKQLFMFTFCSFIDYNSGIIKKYIFFLSFAVHYTVNALFFNDYTMHQIYEDEGSFNINYQLPKILCSAFISTLFLRIILETLVLTDRNILEIKNQENYTNAKLMKTKTLKYVKIKFTIFFVLNFILLIIFWYYLTSFNAVYDNTQIYLLENTFVSFGLSLSYPLFWNIIPAILRMTSLNTKKHDRQCMYSFVKVLQII